MKHFNLFAKTSVLPFQPVDCEGLIFVMAYNVNLLEEIVAEMEYVKKPV